MERSKRTRKAGTQGGPPPKKGNASAVSFSVSTDQRRLLWDRQDLQIETPAPEPCTEPPPADIEDSLPTPPAAPFLELDDDFLSSRLEFEDPYIINPDGTEELEEDEVRGDGGNVGAGDGGERVFIDPRDVRRLKYAASVRVSKPSIFFNCLTSLQDNPLRSWLPHRAEYLEEMLRLEGRGDCMRATVCSSCGIGTPGLRCKDCFGRQLVCEKCVVAQHHRSPFHRIEVRVLYY